MDTTGVAQRYFDAWNAHDREAVAAAFAPDGVYRDPTVPDGLDPSGTGAYAAGLWSAFPDLAFAVDDLVAEGDTLWARWTMSGTDTGGLSGLPPTGRPIAVEGADLIHVAGDGVASVQGFFDSGAVPRQLGMQVVVQPDQAGPFRFGTSVWVSKDGGEPGAVSLTVLEASGPEAQQEVRERTQGVVGSLMAEPGFKSVLLATVGPRMYTISAWETADDVAAIRRNGPHIDAAARFFGDGLATGGQTGVWTPHRVNGMWVRCADCREMVPAEGGRCAAGHELPPAPAYW
ncbi:MAG: ester cyclase [Thermoleophilia bacterium]